MSCKSFYGPMIDDWTLNIENILNSWRGMQCRCMQTNTKTWYENRKNQFSLVWSTAFGDFCLNLQENLCLRKERKTLEVNLWRRKANSEIETSIRLALKIELNITSNRQQGSTTRSLVFIWGIDIYLNLKSFEINIL